MVFKVVKRDTRNIFEHYNGTVNACKFLRDGLNPLASLLYKTFKPYSNMNHTCPYNVRISIIMYKYLLKTLLIMPFFNSTI